MNTNNSRLDNSLKASTKESINNSINKSSHQFAPKASWWLDFWTMSGRKSENQDSLLITNCIMHKDWSGPSPMLVLLADGVSACQFPKQASRIAVQTVAETVVNTLPNIIEQSSSSASSVQSGTGLLNDEYVAVMLKQAVNNANDAMYFSQAYQRVPPLLSTLSGLLCINDRIHLFHTGDSRIYRLGVNELTVLSHDHRIIKGQDKGALSAALGADTTVHLQQDVFTLHQNEYLAIMTDGVYEFIDLSEMQYEVSQSVSRLESTLTNGQFEYSDESFDNYVQQWQLSRRLCEHAFEEGSNDNLSMIMLGMLTPASTFPLHGEPKNQDVHNSFDSSEHIDIKENVDVTKGIDVRKDGEGSKGMDDNNGVNKLSKEHRVEADIEVESIQDKNKLSGNNIKNSIDTKILTQPQTSSFKLPSGFEVGESIDGFTIIKIIARTARSEVYLVVDSEGHQYVLKSPSLNTVDDGNYIRDFLKERKIGLSLSKNRRAGESSYNQIDPNSPVINNVHTKQTKEGQQSSSTLSESGLLRYYPVPASSVYLYHLTEYIEGESLRMFIERNTPCDIWQTHDLLTKIGMAVRVMHRNYLLHQDLKPENILLTKSGAVKLIDFGSTSSSILKDSTRPPVGDLHYAAPEYYTDAPKGVHSDLFSIAVIGFELLTGKLPFTSQELMSPNSALKIPTELLRKQNVPFSSQQALLRAMHRNTNVRYQAIGEFLQEFNPDNMASVNDPEPLIKRNPLMVWHGICLIQSVIIIFLLIKFLPAI